MIVTENMTEENHFANEQLRPEEIEEENLDGLPQVKKIQEMTNELGLLVQKMQLLDAQMKNLRTRIAFARWAVRIGRKIELDPLNSAKLRTELGLVLVALEKMLLRVDQIDSGGNMKVRQKRKELVVQIQQVVSSGEDLMKVAKKLIKFQGGMLFCKAFNHVNDAASTSSSSSSSPKSSVAFEKDLKKDDQKHQQKQQQQEEEEEEKKVTKKEDQQPLSKEEEGKLRKSPKLAPQQSPQMVVKNEEQEKKKDPVYEINEQPGSVIITIQDVNAKHARITLEGDQLKVSVPKRNVLEFQLDLQQVRVQEAMREMLTSDVLRITIPKKIPRQSFNHPFNHPLYGRARWPKF